MEILSKNIWDLRNKLRTYGDEIEQLKINSTFFAMLFNSVTLTFELINYYLNIWKIPPPPNLNPEQIVNTKQENADRVMLITKWMFISVMSAMEYDAKQMILGSKQAWFNELRKKLQQDDKIYLAEIMEKSRDHQLLSHDRFNEFDAILYIRHCVIHNNGISGKDRLYAPIKIQLRTFKKDRMIQSDMYVFYKFTNILTDYYKDWLKSIHAKTA